MPLIKSKTDKAFKTNVRTLMGEVGKSPHVQSRAQALAIAYATKRRSKGRGGRAYQDGGDVDLGPLQTAATATELPSWLDRATTASQGVDPRHPFANIGDDIDLAPVGPGATRAARALNPMATRLAAREAAAALERMHQDPLTRYVETGRAAVQRYRAMQEQALAQVQGRDPDFLKLWRSRDEPGFQEGGDVDEGPQIADISGRGLSLPQAAARVPTAGSAARDLAIGAGNIFAPHVTKYLTGPEPTTSRGRDEVIGGALQDFASIPLMGLAPEAGAARAVFSAARAAPKLLPEAAATATSAGLPADRMLTGLGASTLATEPVPAAQAANLTRAQQRDLILEQERAKIAQKAEDAKAARDVEAQRKLAEQQQELEARARAQRAQEAAAAQTREANLPFREKFAPWAQLLPMMGNAAANMLPFIKAARASQATSKLVNEWNQTIDRTEQALASRDPHASLQGLHQLKAYADQWAQPRSTGMSPAGRAAAAVIPTEASALIPMAYDIGALPADNPERQRAYETMTNPKEMGERVLVPALEGSALAFLGHKLGQKAITPPLARSAGLVNAYTTPAGNMLGAGALQKRLNAGVPAKPRLRSVPTSVPAEARGGEVDLPRSARWMARHNRVRDAQEKLREPQGEDSRVLTPGEVVPDYYSDSGNIGLARGGYADGGMPWFARSEARGLARQGMLHSVVPGRTDKLPTNVSGGAYVLPADHVSHLGQNNSAAGANILNQMFKMGPYGTPGTKMGSARAAMPKMPGLPSVKLPRQAAGGRTEVPIVAAGGEFIVPPEKIAEKYGDVDLGHKILDKWVMDTRKKHIETLRRLKPPKKS